MESIYNLLPRVKEETVRTFYVLLQGVRFGGCLESSTAVALPHEVRSKPQISPRTFKNRIASRNLFELLYLNFTCCVECELQCIFVFEVDLWQRRHRIEDGARCTVHYGLAASKRILPLKMNLSCEETCKSPGSRAPISVAAVQARCREPSAGRRGVLVQPMSLRERRTLDRELLSKNKALRNVE